MEERRKDFKRAILRLEEVLKLEKTAINRDSALLRFELVFELAWKVIKDYARDKGSECYSPKDCFRTAFQLGLIDYDERWLAMVEDRNLVVHIYDDETADGIYERLSDYLKLCKNLESNLDAKLN